MTFNEWLVSEEHVTSEDNIEFELSAEEVYILYQTWTDETGGTGMGLW